MGLWHRGSHNGEDPHPMAEVELSTYFKVSRRRPLSACRRTNGNLSWNEEADSSRGREVSRDFAKLYELDGDPERKKFLDDLFVFMQKRGRLPPAFRRFPEQPLVPGEPLAPFLDRTT
ncbi:UNVERIFIED_CONTAM: hypothetical protein K2H54_002230 [Gekko kuhli]